MAELAYLFIATSCLIISVVASVSFIFTIIDDIMERKRHRTPKYKRMSDMSIKQQRALYRNSDREQSYCHILYKNGTGEQLPNDKKTKL